MAGPVKGDVVVVPFPFSDLTGAKRRPALVLADPGAGRAGPAGGNVHIRKGGGRYARVT